jgi:trk system potassium uptake protein TrkH
MTTFRVEYSGFQRLLISFFQVVSTITTAGFNTIDIRVLSQGTLLFLMLLMLFGASLTGSGTNMKGTSFKSLLKLMINVTYRKRAACLWGQKILLKRVQLASSTFIHYALVLSITSLLLILIEKHPFLPILFETASALCTVGLSMGITAELSALGKSLIILLMLIGRSGILVVGFAMSNKKLSMEREIPKKIVDVS